MNGGCGFGTRLYTVSQVASVPEAYTSNTILFGIVSVHSSLCGDVIVVVKIITYRALPTCAIEVGLARARWGQTLLGPKRSSVFSSAMAEPDTPVWAQGLKRSGFYYEGFVDDHEKVLELHRKYTTTTYGTRTSSRVSTNNDDKENKVHSI